MKKTYTSPLLQQHKYVQELAANGDNWRNATSKADNETWFSEDAWA